MKVLGVLAYCLWMSTVAGSGATVEFSALLGAGTAWNMEAVNDIAIDSQGSIYVVGETTSYDFPATQTYPTSAVNSGSGWRCFITKISSDGSKVIYSTILAGAGGRGIAIDRDGNAYVTGETSGADFPVLNAYQSTRPFNTASSDPISKLDAFVAKLDADGELVFSTLYGGSDREMAMDIALDGLGNLVVVGFTVSSDFPVTSGAAKKTLSGEEDAFVLKFSNDGSQCLLASLVGGDGIDSATSLILDGNSRAYLGGKTNSKELAGSTGVKVGTLGGSDAYVAGLNLITGQLERWIIFGGESSESTAGMIMDSQGHLRIVGETLSVDFPITPSSLITRKDENTDSFVVKWNPTSSEFSYATYLFGSLTTQPLYWPINSYRYAKAGIAIGDSGEVYVGTQFWGDTGVLRLSAAGDKIEEVIQLISDSSDFSRALVSTGDGGVVLGGMTSFSPRTPYFPTTGNAFNRRYNGSASEAFVAKVSLAKAAPRNDKPETAFEVIGSNVSETAFNHEATSDPGEAKHGGETASHSLWWKWTAPTSGALLLDTYGSLINTVMSVYTRDTTGALISIAENDDSPRRWSMAGWPAAYVKVPVQSGVTYWIAVDGKQGATGQVMINFQFSTHPHDDWPGALISGYGEHQASNRGATSELVEWSPLTAGRNSVWWRWTAARSEGVSIWAVGKTSQVDVAVLVSVGANELTPLATSLWSGVNIAPATFLATEGRDYFIVADSSWDLASDFQLFIQRAQPPSNDEFQNAIQAEGWTATLVGTHLNATSEVWEQEGPDLVNPGGRSVWWKWQSPTNGWISLNNRGSESTSLVTVYRGVTQQSLGLIATFTLMETNSGMFRVEENATYHFRADNIAWVHPGGLRLNLQLTQPPEIVPGSTKWTANGTLEFEALGIGNRRYQLEITKDFRTWEALPLGLLSGKNFKVSIPVKAETMHGYFRLREEP